MKKTLLSMQQILEFAIELPVCEYRHLDADKMTVRHHRHQLELITA